VYFSLANLYLKISHLFANPSTQLLRGHVSSYLALLSMSDLQWPLRFTRATGKPFQVHCCGKSGGMVDIA